MNYNNKQGRNPKMLSIFINILLALIAVAISFTAGYMFRASRGERQEEEHFHHRPPPDDRSKAIAEFLNWEENK